jgi:phospholipid/cholesterol/gamma-HCH transport system substrate-binding protein
MKKATLEISVGIFVLLGILCLAYLSIKLGKMELLGSDSYGVTANFDSVSGLREGASVEIAGVEVGRVDRIVLDPKAGYTALVFLRINSGVK